MDDPAAIEHDVFWRYRQRKGFQPGCVLSDRHIGESACIIGQLRSLCGSNRVLVSTLTRD